MAQRLFQSDNLKAMKIQHLSQEDCLRHFLQAISARKLDELAIHSLQKEGSTHPDFDAKYILDQSLGDFIVTGESLLESDEAIYELREEPGGMPYRLTMILTPHWQVSSFEFWCMGCLGENAECGVCGGSGWGVL